MRRPSIKSPCVADRYANKANGERIAEFSSGELDAAGGLLSLRDEVTTPGLGVLVLNLYRLENVRVHVEPGCLGPQSLRAAAKLWAEQNPAKSPDIFAEGEQSRLVDILLTAIENVETLPLGKGYNGTHVQTLKHTAKAIRASRAKPVDPDLIGGDPGYRLINKNGPVILTLEAADNVIERKAAFSTIADAEAYLNTSTTIDPVDLEAGRYGIDAPHGLGSDLEAVPAARRLGYEGHDDAAAALSFLATRIP